MVNEISNPSPFDAIRQVDEDGEHWSARDLMKVMGYARWESFQDTVTRASISATNAGAGPGHFRGVPKVIESGRWGSTTIQDYRLTRFGAYLVAMNGDPRKPEIAAAQTYFAVKTREAEVAPAPAELDELEVARRYVLALEAKKELEATVAEQSAQLAIAAPKAEYVDSFVNPADDASTIRVFAGQLGVGEKQLRDWMVGRGLIYRRPVDQRWSRSKQRLEPVYQWLARSPYAKWFNPVDQPNAPRMHNGQMATTLYVTPVGKVQIRRLLMKHPIDGGEAQSA